MFFFVNKVTKRALDNTIKVNDDKIQDKTINENLCKPISIKKKIKKNPNLPASRILEKKKEFFSNLSRFPI